MMERSVTLTDADGEALVATLIGPESPRGTTFRLPDGRLVMLRAGTVERAGRDEYRLALRFAALRSAGDPAATEERHVVPVVREEAVVETRSVPGATVRVRTRVRERDEQIESTLTREDVEVRRVAVGEFVEAPTQVRQEGDTLIVPLHEEVLVVETRLMLREELHITRHTEERRETTHVRLRSEDVEVEREDPDDTHP